MRPIGQLRCCDGYSLLQVRAHLVCVDSRIDEYLRAVVIRIVRRRVIIGIGATQGGQADVVGYEIDPAESLGRGKQPLLIPLPDTLAAFGEHLMVPASAANYISDNLGGFGSAIDAFRSQLGGVS